MYINNKLLKEVSITNVDSINNFAFANYESIENVRVFGDVKTIGDSAFYGCRYLKSIVLSDNISEVGSLCFADCNNLTDITIPVLMKYYLTEGYNHDDTYYTTYSFNKSPIMYL